MIEQALVKLGLTHNESKIYLCLLKNKNFSASEVTKKTGIHRRNVYDAINRLLDKGLINETQVNNRLRFNAVHPKHLLRMVEENKKQVESILPSLIYDFNEKSPERSVKIYKGVRGIKACFTESLDLMQEREKYYAMGCIDMNKLLGAFIDEHKRLRKKKKIISHTIFNYEHEKRAKEVIHQDKANKVRVHQKNSYLPVQTVVFGDRVTCQILIHDEPFAIQTIDRDFAQNYQKYFHMLWGLARPL